MTIVPFFGKSKLHPDLLLTKSTVRSDHVIQFLFLLLWRVQFIHSLQSLVLFKYIFSPKK